MRTHDESEIKTLFELHQNYRDVNRHYKNMPECRERDFVRNVLKQAKNQYYQQLRAVQ